MNFLSSRVLGWMRICMELRSASLAMSLLSVRSFPVYQRPWLKERGDLVSYNSWSQERESHTIMWDFFTPRVAQKRLADAPVCEQPPPKRSRCCSKFSLAEQAMVIAGLPTSVTDIVNRFATPAHIAAFAKKYGRAAPATYTGEILARSVSDRRRRFGWECNDLRYFVGKDLIFTYRPVRGFHLSEYVKTLVSVHRDRIVVKDGANEFSLQRDRLLSVIAFVDIPRTDFKARVPSCYSDH